MRRLTRGLLTLCSAVSLVLCVAAGVLWARSVYRIDRVNFAREGWVCQARSGWGQLAVRVTYRPEWGTIPPKWTTRRPEELESYRPLLFRPTPFGAAAVRYPGNRTVRPFDDVTVDYWLICAATGTVALAWWLPKMLRRHARPGHCRSCDYDLRATPGRCPECGTATRHSLNTRAAPD